MSNARISQDNDNIRKFLWYNFITEDNSFLGSIATSVISNEVEKIIGNDISNLVRRTKLYQHETSFISDPLFQRLIVLPNSCNMNCEYIPQSCLNQQFKCKK